MKIEKFRLFAGDIAGLAIPTVETLPTSLEENLLVVHQGVIKRASVVKQDWETLPALPPASLFAFTSHTFTNAGVTGRFGPTLGACRTAYNAPAWENDVGLFNVTNGIQLWTVPKTGKYRLTVVGARGGRSAVNTNFYGRGARMIGEFDLVMGDKLRICVGQMGADAPASSTTGSAGGGASFVQKNGVTVPLIVAGGGAGGAGYPTSSADIIDALITAPAGPTYVAQGRATAGGPGASWQGSRYSSNQQNAGQALISSANGGNGDRVGGFGGGAGHYTANQLCAGGGGYTGGSENLGYQAHQGFPQSGSFNAGTNQNNTRSQGIGHGSVRIEFVA